MAEALGVPDSHEDCLGPCWLKLLGLLLSFSSKGKLIAEGIPFGGKLCDTGGWADTGKKLPVLFHVASGLSELHWAVVAPALYSRALSELFAPGSSY